MNKTKRTMALLFAALAMITAAARTVWHNPLEGPEPHLCGRAWNAETGRNYARFPERFKATMPPGIWSLSRQSAGLMVRFRTTSPDIHIRYKLSAVGGYKNMAPLNHQGVDMYATDADGHTRWLGNHMGWSFKDTITISYRQIRTPVYPKRGMDYQVYLPPYSVTAMVEIGVEEGSDFRFVPQSAERPIVVYGSSIVQGASPSRPGLMWTNIVQRETDYPVINLGFSGSAMMEPPLFDAMSEIDARLFILDPMPNSHTLGEEIFDRMTAGVRKLREKSQAPILLMEASAATDSVYLPHLNQSYRNADAILRRAYRQLLDEGVKDLHYLTHQEIGLGEDSWMEGVHPNDLGNREYADAVEKKIREILPQDATDPDFAPVRQHRDGVYEWMERHNEVLRLNHTTNPQTLFIGNSITHFWGGEPRCEARHSDEAWAKLFGTQRVTNMGFGWDRIENVFWRIIHGELEGCSPERICLCIGVNNLNNGEEPARVARGIASLAAEIRRRQPGARLYVIAPYPSRNKEPQAAVIRDTLKQILPTEEGMELVDLSACLTNKDGKIDETLFRDGLHPNDKGYKLLARGLKKVLK